ncbi:uncharacterized protein LOC141855581 [Brevipalpus obovatus]|uniref:uncharacterized protein LOC141855581 n=1 Tax=Brevipalpus obovatus TaxID=246614 RepID=UPI003D9FA352
MMFVHFFLSILVFSIPCNSIPYPKLYDTTKESFPTQNEIISATLRDLVTGYVYQIKQYISATRGFIRTDITDGQISYRLYQSKDSSDRYSIEDGNCGNTNWPQSEDQRWFLLAGPYSLLQSDAFNCYDTNFEVHTEQIRGYTDLDETVKKCNYDSEVVISWIIPDKEKDKPIAVRIETESEKFQLDIFERISLGEKEESTILRLPPGNGCTNLKLTETFTANSPSMDDIRFTSVLSQIDWKSPSRSEVFIDQDHQYARFESFEAETSIVYDLRLGVQYNFNRKEGEILCESGPIQDGRLQTILKWLQAYQDNFESSFGFDHVQYLGKDFCNSGKILTCHIWELTGTNYVHEGDKYDKFVVVFYAFEKMQRNDKVFHIPSSIEQFGYNNKNGKLSREFWQRKDIHAFSNPTYEEIMDTEYRLEKCFDSPESRKTFDFSLALDGGDPTEFLQLFKISDQIKRGIRESFNSRETISLSRIIGIELAQMDGGSDRRILAAVSFVNKPALQKSFLVTDVHVDLDRLKDRTEKLPLHMCMESLSEKNIRNFIFYRAENLCISLTDEQVSTIDTKKGKTFCQMYQNKANKPKNVVQEKGVENLDEELQEFVSKQPAFSINLGEKQRKMRIMKVFSHTASFSAYDYPTSISFQNKFKSDDKKKVTTIEASLADCRRICKNAELTQCNAFSYCETPKGIGECSLVSHSTLLSDLSIVEDSSDCNMYILSSFSLFEKGEEAHVKLISSYESISDGNPETCAIKCLADNKCKSFAVCRGADLTFGCDFFSKERPPVSIDHEQLCTLYSTRDAFSFGVTNDDIVEDVFVTQDSVPFMICSQMCQRSKETACMSFNYCEENNRCQLASATVASTSNLKKVPGCLNYQRDYDYTPPNRSPSSPLVKTVTTLTGGGVFGIVITFFVIGLALGAVGLILVLQYRARIAVSSLSLSTFRWHRQQDEVEVGPPEISDNSA